MPFSLKLSSGFADLNDVVFEDTNSGYWYGPTLSGVIKVEHACDNLKVFFESEKALEVAKQQTGWRKIMIFDSNTNTVRPYLTVEYQLIKNQAKSIINLIPCEVQLEPKGTGTKQVYFARFEII